MFSEEVNMYMEEYDLSLNKALEHFKGELGKIRAGRANPKMIEHVRADFYGTPTPIYQMANISVPDPRSLMISPWDVSVLRSVLKAIDEANLGLTASDDGKVIRLSVPILTEERRRDLVKEVSKTGESARVTCRNERRDVLDVFKKMKKDGDIAEDVFERVEKEVQKQLDSYIKEIDAALSHKEKELLEI